MTEGNNIRCQIYCQKGKLIKAELPADTGIYEEEGLFFRSSEEIQL